MPAKTPFKPPKITKIFLFIIAGWLGFTLIRNTYLLWQSGSRIQEAEKQLEDVTKEHQDLASQLRLIESPQFIEKEARDKLNLAKPGDIIVILPPEEELKKLAPDLSVPLEVSPPNYLQWANLFL